MIHPTAIIDPRAEIDASAEIGPYSVIDGPVVIGPRTRVIAQAYLTGMTTIGADNVIHPGVALGVEPEDLAFSGQESFLRIGDRNVVREHVQVQRGTTPGSATEIGDDNFLMHHAHVAHNCRVGHHVILAAGATLGGYVEVGDGVFISGNCVVHQFVRIGRLALLRGLSRTSRDVPPFCLMDHTHVVRTLNRVGLRRAGFSAEEMRALQRAFVRLFRTHGNLRTAVAELATAPQSPAVDELLAFIRASTRGVCFGPRAGAVEDVD